MSIKQGEYLKKLRTEKGLSQDALGEVLGISRQSVSKWEQGNSTPDIDNIGKLAEFYGVSIDSLVKGESDEEVKVSENTDDEEKEKVLELIDEFEGKVDVKDEKIESKVEPLNISAPEPSLKEKELIEKQNDEAYKNKREYQREEMKKEKKRKKLAFPVLSRYCSYCLLRFWRCFRCKRLENRLDNSFDNSSFLHGCYCD